MSESNRILSESQSVDSFEYEFLDPLQFWLNKSTLPEEDSLYQWLAEKNGRFRSDEGRTWDFKDEWPFSLSDDYFGGIARLVCAFSNTSGGVIVFGVHDKNRTGGHNKVLINFDKFSMALENLFGQAPHIALKRCTNSEIGNIDCLFVKPRSAREKPTRFVRSVGKYKAGIFWVRRGGEVVAATPADYPSLFCRTGATTAEASFDIDGSLPPSPAKIKRFVGRLEVLDSLFAWLERSDEPRSFLHGKGGSGKTTIAYEFCRLVKQYGSNLRLYDNDRVEVVLFLSAKEKKLETSTGEIVDESEPDFADERSLLSSILYFGEWSKDKKRLDALKIDELRSEVKDFFDLTSCLIVIDDIDTLTTKNIDSGSDFIYRTLCRSKQQSKVLYTLRNAPTQSLTNSVEVPGLQQSDYEEFVSECATEFNVQPPADIFRDTTLSQISEHRPLVIESIVALVRTSGSYDRAKELFEQHAGDDVRSYVFSREWDTLRSDGIAKLLLAALSEINEPTTFLDLQAVLQADVSRIRDAIGAVREMFLQIDEAGDEALYSVAPLTRSFILMRKTELSGFGVLRERVKAFKRNTNLSNPRVASILSQIERLLPKRFVDHPREKVSESYRMVTDRLLPVFVTEDPLFRTALGYVCCLATPPRFTEAREAFEYAISMKHEPEFKFLLAWYNAEKESGSYDHWSLRITDFVLQGKRYDEFEKLAMLGRRANTLFARGNHRYLTDPTDAITDFKNALILHLRVLFSRFLRVRELA